MHPICVTCGTQFADAADEPESCPICADERQYVGWDGQRWTTLAALRAEGRRNVVRDDHGLLGLATEPKFAIGQRALLVPTSAGNVLWESLTLIDDATVAALRERGGVAAIAISHPHFYSAMVEYAHAFDVPVYLHAADRQWVMRPDPAIRFWEGDSNEILPGVTLIRCGGHFAGSTVLHRAHGDGVLLSGDTVQVTMDRRHVSFMYSYPNYVPLGAAAVRQIVLRLAPYRFARVYGVFFDLVIAADGEAAVRRSAERHLRAIAAA